MTNTFGSGIVLGVVGSVLLWIPATAQAAAYIQFGDGEARAAAPAPVAETTEGVTVPDQKSQETGAAPVGEPPETTGSSGPDFGEGGGESASTEVGSPPVDAGVPVAPNTATGSVAADEPSQPVAVSAAALRELSEEQRAVLIQSAPQDPEMIATPEDLRSFVAATIEQHPQIDAVHVEETKVLVRYETPAKLFGFIPLTVTETIEVAPGQGDEEYAVSVHRPWYSIFLSDTAPGQTVTSLARAGKKPKPAESVQIESFSFGASNAGRAIKLIADGIGQANDAYEREADQVADR